VGQTVWLVDQGKIESLWDRNSGRWGIELSMEPPAGHCHQADSAFRWALVLAEQVANSSVPLGTLSVCSDVISANFCVHFFLSLSVAVCLEVAL